MRISKIRIENFRSIKHAEFTPSELNVFVGQNNHGKTNLFEAIEWFYNGGNDFSQIPHMRDQQCEVAVEITYTGVQGGIEAVKNEKTKKSFADFAAGSDEVRVIRRKSDGGKRALWVAEKNEWSSKNFAGFDKAFNDCLPRLQYVSTTTRLGEVSKYAKKTPIGDMLSGVLGAIMEKSPEYKDFKSKFEALFEDENSEVRKELNALGVKVRDHLTKQFPECAKVVFEVGEPAFEDLLKNFGTCVDDGIETTASEKGDGMQRALMLAIIQTYSDYRREKDELGKRFLFLIDEAELHLHPTAQRQLKNALLVLASNGDQVLVNTHSSVLVVDEHAIQSIYTVQKKNHESSIIKVGAIEKPQVVFELLGGSPADLLFPCNFVVVEGRTEFELLTRVIRRFYPNNKILQIIFASGDAEQQKRSIDAINVAFTPLNQTSVYRNKLVVLCDKPNGQQEPRFNQFRQAYPHLEQNNQIFVLPEGAIEMLYPAQWRKSAQEVATMKMPEKTALAKIVGDGITQAEFEAMGVVHQALQRAWALAH